ncbi:MAG: penicillin-binding protein, partial [Thermoleophilaceae bacterium]|nr:penicillin-binding protein [Thermoleophilaceae bacterium]
MPSDPHSPIPPPGRAGASDAARRALALDTASSERRRRLTHRLLPALVILAVAAFVVGLVSGAGQSEAERAGRDFVSAWQHGNYPAMHAMLTPAAQRRVSTDAFAAAYRSAAATATATRIDAGEIKSDGDRVRVPLRVPTRVFGTVRGTLELHVVDGRVDWSPELVFPGMRAGEQLARDTKAPERARILDRHGHKIVSGPVDARAAVPGAASSIAGSLEAPKTDAERAALYARGFPPDTLVGSSGLERALE